MGQAPASHQEQGLFRFCIEVQGEGSDYEFLKRRRVREAEATYIQPNEKYLMKALEELGLE